MEQQTVNTSEAPEVIIEAAHGNLMVKGWEEAEVRANSDSGGGLNLVEEGDSVRITCQGDLTVRLPVGATVKIDEVHGDARLKLLEGPLTIKAVMGSLSLRSLAQVNIETVQGDLGARDVSGDVHIEQVNGNVAARDIQGEFYVDRANGDLVLRDVEGVIRVNAEGSARLRLSSLTEGSYRIDVRGDLHCRIPEDASVQMNLTSKGQTLVLDLPRQRTTLHQEQYSLSLEDGETEMDLFAGGMISLSAREVEWVEPEGFRMDFEGDFAGVSSEYTQQIAKQIESQIEAQMARLNEQMSRLSEMVARAGLSEDEAERLMQRARESTEQATTRAQEKIARAQERLARKMEAAARKAEQRARAAERRGHSRAWPFEGVGIPRPPVPPRPPMPSKEAGEPVSDEERLMILNMLEQKKITLEQAEQLLAALEGKGG